MLLPTNPLKSGLHGVGVRPCFDLQNQNGVFFEKEEWVLQHLVLSRLINRYKSFYN